RTSGPGESEQTRDSLRRYLLEETYEVFDAVRGGNADELREELGDVLLQVLFHARIAEDAPQHPFTIDDVADALRRKRGNPVPAPPPGGLGAQTRQPGAGSACRRTDFTRRAAGPVGAAQGSGAIGEIAQFVHG